MDDFFLRLLRNMLPTIYVSFLHSSDESRLHVHAFQTFLSIGPGPRQAKEPFACCTACTRGGRLTKGHPGVNVPAGPGSRSPPLGPPARRQRAATPQALRAPVGEARGNKPAGTCRPRPRPAVRPAWGRRRRAGSGRLGPGRGGGLSRKLPPRRPRPFRRPPGAGGRHFRPGDGVVAVVAAAAAGEKEGAWEPPPPRGRALRHHLALLPRRQVRRGGVGCGGRSRSRPPRGGRASSRSGARCPAPGPQGPPRDAGESRPGGGTSPPPRNWVPGRCARLAGVCAARAAGGLRGGREGRGRFPLAAASGEGGFICRRWWEASGVVCLHEDPLRRN